MTSLRSLAAAGIVALTFGCASSGQMSANGIARLERAHASRPNDAAVVRSLGIAYYKAGRFADARKQLDQAVRLDPRDGSAALYLGLTAEKQSDFTAAKAAYQNYVRYGRTSKVRKQLESRLAALTRLELQGAAKSAVAQEQKLSGQTPSPRTVAVMPLRFVGQDSSLRPLERGLAELIIVDLSRSHLLTVVERARLQAIVDELALQQSGQTEASTNVRAGKIIQAGRIVNGQILQNARGLRVDAAIVNTSTAALAGGAANENTLDQLFALQKAIVLQLFDSLGVVLTTAERNAVEQRPTRSLQAFLAFSRGLRLEDQGRYDEAARSFGDAMRFDPSFGAARQKNAETTAAAIGMVMTPAVVESSLSGTAEGAVATRAAAGDASSGTSGASSESSASSTANSLNPSSSGNATGAAGTGVPSTPQRDPLAAAVGNEGPARNATVTIVVRIPTSKPQ